MFPPQPHDGRSRTCVVSTSVGAYPGVPDEASLALLSNVPRSFMTRATLPLANGTMSCWRGDAIANANGEAWREIEPRHWIPMPSAD